MTESNDVKKSNTGVRRKENFVHDAAGDWLQNTRETQPYVVVASALALGLFLGRMHRPI